MLEKLPGIKVSGVLGHRRNMNRDYLMRLKTYNLLLPFYTEAALVRITYMPEGLHDGWDSPLSEIRGTVVGHWLSSAAMIINETGDRELSARADFMVDEIERCQRENDGVWCFPIPEKYLLWLKRGKRTWAPTYVLHKTLMGLLDMYRYAGNEKALAIIMRTIPWFVAFTDDITEEQMIHMMWEETGGIMELFADLYAVTGDERCLTLMRRYERKELYNALLEGKNPLVNQHANITISEMHGAARAYEVTGEERYRKVVEAYWNIAVEQCGMFATGGQTSGESWTPPGVHSSRLGESNQEHCVVYNMMRLADYLFRWTGKREYADYWERNLLNGVFAQTYHRGNRTENLGGSARHPEDGHLAYFLPLHAGAHKHWGSETGDFWCCHCTLMQANAFFNQYIFYRDDDGLVVAQYQDAFGKVRIGEQETEVWQWAVTEAGDIARLEPCNSAVMRRPMYVKRNIRIKPETESEFTVKLRVPWWCDGVPVIKVDDEDIAADVNECGFAEIHRVWTDNVIEITIPKAITVWKLPDRPNTVAFLDGPVVLAGLCEHERTLTYKEKPEEILIPADERRWNYWCGGWQTKGQYENIRFKPLNEIGYETYTVYFETEKK